MEVVKFDAKGELDRNKNIYECNTCSVLFNWSKDSRWYGSYKDQEDDPTSVPYFCSDKCFSKYDVSSYKKRKKKKP